MSARQGKRTLHIARSSRGFPARPRERLNGRCADDRLNQPRPPCEFKAIGPCSRARSPSSIQAAQDERWMPRLSASALFQPVTESICQFKSLENRRRGSSPLPGSQPNRECHAPESVLDQRAETSRRCFRALAARAWASGVPTSPRRSSPAREPGSRIKPNFVAAALEFGLTSTGSIASSSSPDRSAATRELGAFCHRRSRASFARDRSRC